MKSIMLILLLGIVMGIVFIILKTSPVGWMIGVLILVVSIFLNIKIVNTLFQVIVIATISVISLTTVFIKTTSFSEQSISKYNISSNKSSMVSVGVNEDDLGNIVNGQFYFDNGTSRYYSSFDTVGNPHIYYTNSKGQTKAIFDGFGWSFAVYKGWLYFSGNEGTQIDGTYTLFRTKLDGSDIEHINNTYSVNMNFYNNYLYYGEKTDYYASYSSLIRSSIDGENKDELVEKFNDSSLGVVYDNELYYLDLYNNVYKADSDGSNPQQIINEEVNYFIIGQGKIIYLDSNSNIKSVNIDGTDTKTIRENDGTSINKINSYKDNIMYIKYDDYYVYESKAWNYSIYTIKTNGTNNKKVYDGLSNGFYANILDNKIYVLDYAFDSSLNKMIAVTSSMNLDGSNFTTLYRQ